MSGEEVIEIGIIAISWRLTLSKSGAWPGEERTVRKALVPIESLGVTFLGYFLAFPLRLISPYLSAVVVSVAVIAFNILRYVYLRKN